MIAASTLTIKHFFDANYPASIWEGSFCDISAFFNCDSSAFALISQVGGVPLGYFGLFVGALVSLGAVFPSAGFERTNRTKHLGTYGVILLAGAYGFALYHDARKDAQTGGVATRVVEQYFSLPEVATPSILSPYWSVRSTQEFEDAPIRIIEYADFLCSDCLYLYGQLEQLREEFKGKINIAFQFFPLDAQCNDVVEKDLHPGACDLSYMSAYDPSKFVQIHDEIFENFRAARNPEWRMELARRYGVEAALTDSATRRAVHRIIKTGTEYEKTSDRYAHGIRSTPTMIVNNRMIIGTFPHEQLRAIFQALVDEHERGEGRRFMENWVEE